MDLSVILKQIQDRAIITYLGTIDKLLEEIISDLLFRECRHFHVASYFLKHTLRPGPPNLFQHVKNLVLTISFDTNWDPVERWRDLDKILPMTDFFLPKENALLALASKQSIDTALDEITKIDPLVVIKLSADGAVFSNGKIKIKVYPPKIHKIADTIGACDSFNAGFTYGYLNDWCHKDALRLAVLCGSLSLRKHGGIADQATLNGAKRLAGF